MPKEHGLTGKDFAAMLGLALVVGGAGWIYRPLAPILAGLVIFVYCFVTVKR